LRQPREKCSRSSPVNVPVTWSRSRTSSSNKSYQKSDVSRSATCW
jgi:hypothetical protein